MTMAASFRRDQGPGGAIRSLMTKALSRIWSVRPGWWTRTTPTPTTTTRPRRKLRKPWRTTTIRTRTGAGPPRRRDRTMTRAEMHRAAKAKDKLARSGKYGNIGVNPNPGPSRNKHGDAGMNAGNMLRSASHQRQFQGWPPRARILRRAQHQLWPRGDGHTVGLPGEQLAAMPKR